MVRGTNEWSVKRARMQGIPAHCVRSSTGDIARRGKSTGSKGGADGGQATSRSVETGRDHTVVRERLAALDQAVILMAGLVECNDGHSPPPRAMVPSLGRSV